MEYALKAQSEIDFETLIGKKNVVRKSVREPLVAIKSILAESGITINATVLRNFLQRFVVLPYDFDRPDLRSRIDASQQLRSGLAGAPSVGDADDLFLRLRDYASQSTSAAGLELAQ